MEIGMQQENRITDVKLPDVQSLRGKKAVSIELNRGGGHWLAYKKLSPDLKVEWDAFEYFVNRLSTDKYLYMYGRFSKVPATVGKILADREKHSWIGLCSLSPEADLHAVYVANPLEVYDYLVANRELSVNEAVKIANIPGKREFDEFAYSCCESVYCCLEEGEDRDYFGVTCDESDFQEIVNCVRAALQKFDVK